jgi:hypothetical protein
VFKGLNHRFSPRNENWFGRKVEAVDGTFLSLFSGENGDRASQNVARLSVCINKKAFSPEYFAYPAFLGKKDNVDHEKLPFYDRRKMFVSSTVWIARCRTKALVICG